MRYILAAVSLVISLVLLGLGIGQRTIWAPPETIVAQLEQSTDAQILVISGETMNQHDGRQTLSVSGNGPITAVVGRDHDVLGWVGETEHALVQLDAADALSLEELGGDSEPAPTIAGSDMWIEEHEGEGSVSFPIDLPVGYSIAIQGEPGQAAPAALRIEWPFDAKTPLFGPLMTAGFVFLALALVLFLLALRRHRRRRGPQRRSHRELSRAERRALVRDARAGLPLPDRAIAPSAAPNDEQAAIEGADASAEPASESSQADGAETPTTDTDTDAPGATDASAGPAGEDPARTGRTERRASPARRRLGLVALPALAAIALTGCGPEYWPSPEPSETVASPSPTSLEETLPQVALTENQFDHVLEETRRIVGEADDQRWIEHAANRIAGPVLEARRTNYEVRDQDEEIPALQGIADGEVQLLLPQQRESWPRTVLAVVGWQDDAQAQSALVFEQADARSNYRLVYQTTLGSGVQVPAVASPTIGAATLPGDTPLLLHQPDEITAAYADVLINGQQSDFNDWFQREGDALREQVGQAWKAGQQSRPEYELTEMEWFAEEDEQAPLLLVTNDGGALLASSYNETQRITPAEDGVEVEAQAGPAILAGVERSTTGIEQTYQMQMLFYIPPADAGDDARIQVLGYAQSLLDAQEVQE